MYSILLLLLISAFLYALPLLRTGAGYAAKMVCSCVYVQNNPQSVAEIQAEKLNFSVLGSSKVAVYEDTRSVTASFFGLAKREARFVPGRGCILINDTDTPLPAEYQKPAVQISHTRSDFLLKPDTATLLGINTSQLKEALDYGMQRVPGGGASAIVILRNGKVLAERYDDYYGPQTPILGWSMTKSITGALVGMRVADGAIEPEERPVFTRWANEEDLRRQIPLLNLLQMNSGLKWEEAYGGVTDATIMLHDQPDMAAYAKKKPVAVPPATNWVYSSGTSNLLMDKVRGSFDDDTDFLNYLYDSLFHAIGANSFLIETDQSGLPVGSSYGWATARDWAKMGQLFLNEGKWRGKEIIPAQWIKKMREPAAGSGGIYGGQIWLKGPDTPSLPDDAYAFRGFQGQRVFILPSQQIVIVRLGHNDDKVVNFDRLIEGVLNAIGD
ncbi:hypothetical protein CEQ90_18465 [Lewinellaceae bacterium SD302]|nr:hypothetical protein CEQ90_18465 [Lewinellaceae bacterium SD302]